MPNSETMAADRTPERPFGDVHLVQLTDCHLGPHTDYRLAGVHTLHSFDEVLARVGAIAPVPDMLVVTGDIAAHGSKRAYELFARRMEAAGLPWAWLPGNHDDKELLATLPAMPAFHGRLARGKWRLLCLDTAVPGSVAGALSRAQLDLLDASLGEAGADPVALFMHHPPAEVGCEWLDRQRVANGDEMAEIVAERGNVRAIFAGHVHQEAVLDFAGVPLYCTPSTCFQFAPGRAGFALDSRPPAFRRIRLGDDGAVESTLHWIEDTAESVDVHARGY